MKSNLLIGTSCMLAACVVLYACQKQLSPAKASPSITASATNASTGEKVTLNVNNIPTGTHLVWSSTSPSATQFNASVQGSAVVSFTTPGTYKITCYVMSGDGADSLPVFDTTHNPYDTIPVYPPPPPPPHDSVPNYPYDTMPGNPHDTTPYYPHDTTPGYPRDTTPVYPHDTTPVYPHDTTPNYPHDTTPNYPPPPHDSTHVDSTSHAPNNHVIAVLTIIITVH